ncbi:hypothetical protein [Blastococcus sp. TBT05-19]|uniref:hypothetical protein n=1 Tax=Blastococcus sp. TBT05-19 TaxID=2250581 RepID=UPI001314519E|nr:hypothetical protein [Blastococcus sp. TBT05-19]
MPKSQARPSESASVVAARQLAEEAQRRRKLLADLRRRHRPKDLPAVPPPPSA